ncbi:short-chain dehydrogenase [Stemphylium lycopersici]|uniref:Short-chain dehydrogenase n=1 Tax=Stemphylium lycopersici TaxID=183478 RepID=A0A364NGQ3_STELY|nr:short-chain dehydrogenase [Stemphylium lycopersici]RAR16427.1 short-chain dehydrogenase [Stemphylium lycopersici]
MTTRYAAAHQTPKGPGDQRPTASQIIKDEELQGKWAGKTVLITGCSSGIGIETAKALFETGATLYLTARDLNKAKTALGSLVESDRVHLLELDLNSLASVRKCADEFLSKSDKLNILIPNAGIMASPEGKTADGFELQFGTNHLAHFLLIQLLLPTLVKSSTPELQSRVVILSSVAHRRASINFDNLSFKGQYNPWAAYGQSKIANLYTANELERRFGKQGVHAWAVHPGLIFTGLMQFIDEETQKEWNKDPTIPLMLKSPEQGASTTVWAATAKALEGQGGRYLEECQISTPAKADPKEFDAGHAANAYDEETERKLWEKSLELVKPFLA